MNQIVPSDLTTDVVRRVEPFAFKSIGQNADLPVVLQPRQGSVAVRTGDQPPRAVARVAVGKAGMGAEHPASVRFAPAHHPIVGKVAEQEHRHVAEPDGPFGPAKAAAQLFQRRIGEDIGLEDRIDDLEPLHGDGPNAGRRASRVPPHRAIARSSSRKVRPRRSPTGALWRRPRAAYNSGPGRTTCRPAP